MQPYPKKQDEYRSQTTGRSEQTRYNSESNSSAATRRKHAHTHTHTKATMAVEKVP